MSADVHPTDRTPQLVMALLDLNRRCGGLTAPLTLRIDWDNSADAWRIEGYAFTVGGEDDQLDLVGAWANALGGTLHLDEPRTFELPGFYRKTYRHLYARADLFGVAVQIEVHVDEAETPWIEVTAQAAGIDVPDDGRDHFEEAAVRRAVRAEQEEEHRAEVAERAAAAA